MCEYVDVWMSGIMGPTFYCRRKYESAAPDCSADALCVWNRTSYDCDVAESVFDSAYLAANTVRH